MKATLIVLCLSLGMPACVDFGNHKLTLEVESTRLVADGESGTSVKVCNDSSDAADVTATLRASVGSWEGASDTDPRSIELSLSADAKCESVTWICPSKVGPVHFEVETSDVVRLRETRTLQKAEVVKIDLQGGLLNEDQVSALELTADFTTTTGGNASDGTIVDLRVESTPLGMAYLSNDAIVVGKRDRVTVYAPAGTASVRVWATENGSSEPKGCKEFTSTSFQSCL